MQVTEVNSDGLKRDFKVVIEAKEITEKVENRLREISARVKIPGFRPGKAPIKLLKQRYGPSVMGEVLERAVTDSSAQALNERGLRPAVQPKRPEEHTSELQSLMRTSYAVFCLKKKKNTKTQI